MGGETAVSYRLVERGTDEYEASRELRYRVMYVPFGLSREFVDVGRDGIHMGGFSGTRLVAYGRLAVDDQGGGCALYQIVVDEAHQGTGVGRTLVEKLLDVARGRGLTHVRLDARVPAVGFYERLGFVVTGAEFRNPTGLPHRPMARTLG